MNLLNEREKTHGDYIDVASVAQALKEALRTGPIVEVPKVHRESLDMICTKMARIVCGDHNEPDHWTDIKGYAELVLKHIKSEPPGTINQGTPDERSFPPICPHCGLRHGIIGSCMWYR